MLRDLYRPHRHLEPIYVGAIAFACNKDGFAEKGYDYPTSWDDLLDPKYEGMVIMAHLPPPAPPTPCCHADSAHGRGRVWDYLKELDKNMSQYTKSGANAPNPWPWARLPSPDFSHDGLQPTVEGYPIELSFPTDGTGYEVGAMALIKGGPPTSRRTPRSSSTSCALPRARTCTPRTTLSGCPSTLGHPGRGLVTMDSVTVIDYDAVWAAENKTVLPSSSRPTSPALPRNNSSRYLTAFPPPRGEGPFPRESIKRRRNIHGKFSRNGREERRPPEKAQ